MHFKYKLNKHCKNSSSIASIDSVRVVLNHLQSCAKSYLPEEKGECRNVLLDEWKKN